MCIEFLQLYGYDIPYKPSRLAVFLEKKRLKKLLAPNGTHDAILRAPIASKTEAISASAFLGKLSVFALLSGNFTLSTLSSLYHIKHARDYGVTIHTAIVGHDCYHGRPKRKQRRMFPSRRFTTSTYESTI